MSERDIVSGGRGITASWSACSASVRIQTVVKNGGSVGTSRSAAMDDHPLTCTPETELDEARA